MVRFYKIVRSSESFGNKPWWGGSLTKLMKRCKPIKGIVLVLMGQVRNAFLMNVYLDVRNPRGSGFWNEGYMNRGREMESLVYEQPGNEVDGSYHSKEGSK
jgi:hypothetical protein